MKLYSILLPSPFVSGVFHLARLQGSSMLQHMSELLSLIRLKSYILRKTPVLHNFSGLRNVSGALACQVFSGHSCRDCPNKTNLALQVSAVLFPDNFQDE